MVGPSAAIAGGFFVIVWMLIMVGMIAGWIVFLIAMWRGMKAHESIARSLTRMADK